jgi:16S rRNA (cytosine967-C5)-methyltransferase
VRDRIAVDWTQGSGGASRSYDRALVDAPCTGTGTLRRRPEIAERLSASDPERMASVQLSIALRVGARLKPGGRMVYAVCSVLGAECEGVVAALVKSGLELCPFDSELARSIAGDAPTFRLLPHVHGTDGYFLASLRRPREAEGGQVGLDEQRREA